MNGHKAVVMLILALVLVVFIVYVLWRIVGLTGQ